MNHSESEFPVLVRVHHFLPVKAYPLLFLFLLLFWIGLSLLVFWILKVHLSLFPLRFFGFLLLLLFLIVFLVNLIDSHYLLKVSHIQFLKLLLLLVIIQP